MVRIIPQELNNNEQNMSIKLKIRRSLKPLIMVQTILGINRIHLIKFSKLKKKLINLYSFVIIILNIYLILIQSEVNISNWIAIFIYISLSMIYLHKSEDLAKFLQNLTMFDENFKIGKNLNVASTKLFTFVCMVIVLLLNVAEYLAAKDDLTKLNTSFVMFVIQIAIALELVFQISLFRFVYIRSVNLSNHIEKVFEERAKSFKIQMISNDNDLTVTELHKIYERLYRCSHGLNSVVQLPLMFCLITTVISVEHHVMLFTSENVFISDDCMKKLIYYGLKLIKYDLYVTIPCLYSTMTMRQSDVIRNVLHAATMRYDMGNIEHRKVKAFFHLTREFNFSYTVFGAIKLDMSVPLYILSLIIVYFVIIIQINQFVKA